jgi:DNA-binding MurR/RpiR family transcriptional regulator
MSNAQKAIADYIVANPQKFALSSVRQLEIELGTSKSTIVRLAQKLGYEGFLELKTSLLDGLRRNIHPFKNYKSLLNNPENQSDYLNMLAQESFDNINDCLCQVDPEQIDLAVKLLTEADHIYAMGMGVSSFLANMAAYLLTRIGMRCFAMSPQVLNYAEQVINLGPNDVVMAFCFRTYARNTMQAMQTAHDMKLKSIAVSDLPTSPLAPLCDAFFPVPVKSLTYSHSIVAPLVLLYSLVAHVAHQRKDQTLSSIEAIEQLRKKPGHD